MHPWQWYLVPEVRGQQEVRLFRATSFPTSWELAGVLLSQPLGGISVVQHGQHWWLIGHKEGAGQGRCASQRYFCQRLCNVFANLDGC